MLSSQKQVLESFRRVQGFLAAHPLESPATYGAPEGMLADAFSELSTQLAAQESAKRLRRAGTQEVGTLVKELREQHLLPITAIARATLKGSPGIDAATRMPPSDLALERLLNVAAAFAKAVEPYQQVFVDHGRPADFVARLDAAVAALQAAMVKRIDHVRGRIAATAEIARTIRKGQAAVRMLDATIKATFADNEAVVTEWNTVRRVQALPGGGINSPAAVPTVPVTPVPAASANAGGEHASTQAA